MFQSLPRPAHLVSILAALALAGCDGTSSTKAPVVRDGGGVMTASPGTLSNTPQAEFWVVESEEAVGLELVSSSLLPDPNSTINYVQWFGEVRNTGSKAACYVYATLDFRTAGGGRRVHAMKGMARAYPHVTSKTSTQIPCIPPGGTAGLYGNDIPAVPVRLEAIGQVEIYFDQSLFYPDAAPSTSTPSVAGVTIVEDTKPGSWIATGTLTATGAISGVALTVFYKDGAGLILDEGSASRAETLNAGASWVFKTSAYAGERPSEVLLATDFKTGT
jgi:hypothetical protein